MHLFPCRQYQICRCSYTTNITQLKHAAVVMYTIPNMQLLLCNQYHSAEAHSCCHAHNTKDVAVVISEELYRDFYITMQSLFISWYNIYHRNTYASSALACDLHCKKISNKICSENITFITYNVLIIQLIWQLNT